jgi:23S rRNA (uracil1939-C5)-methyltransferase
MNESSRLRPGSRLTVQVDRLAVGGKGVCRHEGLVIFVPDVIPGEKIEIEITRAKKNFAEARLVEIVEVSPQRVTPPCEYVGQCGGCSWQHIAYDEQLRWKKEMVAEALAKFSGFPANTIRDLVADILPSPQAFRYRNRIQVHLDQNRVGFHQRGSHRLIEIKDCLIADETLTRLFNELRSERHSKASRLELFMSESGKAAIRGTEGSEDETAFAQVNTAQNDVLIRYVEKAFVTEGADTVTDLKIFDLYAGNGNFTFPLAVRFSQAEVTSVELNHRSVETARKIAAKKFAGQPPRRLRIEEADVAVFLSCIGDLNDAFVLLDPPRTGCAPEVMRALVSAVPRAIVYVSCHPVTLGRDLHFLSEAGYELVSIQPVDMFPQTDHVETVVVARRRSLRK